MFGHGCEGQRLGSGGLSTIIFFLFFKAGLRVNPALDDLTGLTCEQTLRIRSSLRIFLAPFCNRAQELRTQVVDSAWCDDDRCLGTPVRDYLG